MSSPTDLPTLLRFLTQDAKVPLATALASVQALQQANLTSIESISKAKPDQIQNIFQQQQDAAKISKQVLNAAKKRSKKRTAASNDGGDGEDNNNTNDNDNNINKPLSSPRKKNKNSSSIFSLHPSSPQTPTELEASLQLPHSSAEPAELADVVLFTNRAPLVLAFVVVLLKHTMPEQPLSARLSLAQAYVSMTSRARAVDLGIESGRRAEELEEAGMGRASVVILGKEVRVLKRWGYDGWGEEKDRGVEESTQGDDHGGNDDDDGRNENENENGQQHIKSEQQDSPPRQEEEQQQQSPALWGLDLESLSKSSTGGINQSASTTANNNMPIHTPQSARAYLLKSFDSPPPPTSPSSAQPSKKKKVTASAKAAEKERNLGMLLRAIDLLYASWIGSIGRRELDRRVWGWYVKVRPAVEQGAAGWGGKNEVRLAEILALRRE